MSNRDTLNPTVMTLGQRILAVELVSHPADLRTSERRLRDAVFGRQRQLLAVGRTANGAVRRRYVRDVGNCADRYPTVLKYAYLFYAGSLILLIAVEVAGTVGMGAQRWIDLKVFHLQPSELMKIALVLSLARYFHRLSLDDVARPTYLVFPILLVAAPVALVMRQPDLGTSLLLLMGSVAMFFLAGVRIWKFVLVGLIGLSAIPVAWSMLHAYQKNRIMTFLSPESDPLGAGYHALQSFIALGSGGISGKGFLKGTQSHLSFLPEMQTDFIFTMYAEEFGLIGGLLLIALYATVIAYTFAIAIRSRNHFGRLVAMGIATMFFLYVFINIAMVTGLTPVVGVPLPLISYGGTAMMTVLIGFGLVMNVYIHRDMRISRHGEVSNNQI